MRRVVYQTQIYPYFNMYPQPSPANIPGETVITGKRQSTDTRIAGTVWGRGLCLVVVFPDWHLKTARDSIVGESLLLASNFQTSTILHFAQFSLRNDDDNEFRGGCTAQTHCSVWIGWTPAAAAVVELLRGQLSLPPWTPSQYCCCNIFHTEEPIDKTHCV